MYNLQEDSTLGDVSNIVPRIYTTLKNRQVNPQYSMINIKVKLKYAPSSILIDSISSYSYINTNLYE